jgi:hypothetical protein
MMLPVEGHHLRTVDLGQGTPLLQRPRWSTTCSECWTRTPSTKP